jgi:hypothetical protein
LASITNRNFMPQALGLYASDVAANGRGGGS